MATGKGKFAATISSAKGKSPKPIDGSVKKIIGKRGDAEWKQMGIFVKKKTYREVTYALMGMEEDNPGFSELVDSLLVNWLESK